MKAIPRQISAHALLNALVSAQVRGRVPGKITSWARIRLSIPVVELVWDQTYWPTHDHLREEQGEL